MFPWESLCYEVGGIPGVSTVTAPPEQSLDAIMGCREQVLEYSEGIVTLKGWQAEISKREQSLMKLDPDIDVDIEFLNTFAEPLIIANLKTDVLETLPTVDKQVSLKQAGCENECGN